MSPSIGAIGLAVLLISAGCALDERELRLRSDDDGSAGPFVGGGPSGGSSPTSSGGGDDGVSGSDGSTPLVDGCADLDTDGAADCEATLVENPSFTKTIDGWRADTDGALTWDARNALDDAPSGSLRLRTQVTQSSAWQCLRLAGEHVVIAYANAYVEPTEEGDDGRAVLAVTFFEEEECLGEGHAFFETPASAVTGEWTTLQAGSTSTVFTRSLSVALIGVKGATAAEQTSYFDNVMLRAHAP